MFGLLGPDDAAMPAWMTEVGFWATLGGLLTLIVAAAGIWSLVVHVRRLREDARALGTLAELDAKLERLVKDRADLDLRRLEHVLIDLRDAQLRLEEALLRSDERRRRAVVEGLPDERVALAPPDESIGERVTNRLLALGYEQIHIVTRADKLAELLRNDGEILVEAKRDGVLHKGRVDLRAGRLADVEMNPAYSIFP